MTISSKEIIDKYEEIVNHREAERNHKDAEKHPLYDVGDVGKFDRGVDFTNDVLLRELVALGNTCVPSGQLAKIFNLRGDCEVIKISV